MRVVAGVVGLLGGVVAILLATNPAPHVPVISDVGGSTQPYVVKLHARWCPVCMATKDEWAAVQDAYTGRVRFVVFDFTSAATTDASRAEARRLGLDAVFDEYSGATGTVLVLDGAKAIKHSLQGVLDQSKYRAAIDATLKGTH